MAEFSELNAKAMNAIGTLVKKQPLSVIGINKEGENWEALVEVLERRAVPDTQNLIGIYKITLDKGNNVVGYKRVEVRRKCDIGKETEETPGEEEK